MLRIATVLVLFAGLGRAKSPEPALYDLQEDVAEQTDIEKKEHEERVATMRKALAAWESELEVPRWRHGRRRKK